MNDSTRRDAFKDNLCHWWSSFINNIIIIISSEYYYHCLISHVSLCCLQSQCSQLSVSLRIVSRQLQYSNVSVIYIAAIDYQRIFLSRMFL